jgi:hypothetical protein
VWIWESIAPIMNTKRIFKLIAILTVSLVMDVMAEEPVLQNGSFENGLKSWSPQQWRGNAAIEIDGDIASAGKSSVRIKSGDGDYAMVVQYLKLQSNTSYKLSFVIRGQSVQGDKTKGGNPIVLLQDTGLEKGKTEILIRPLYMKGDFDWTKEEIDFTTKEVKGKIGLYLGMRYTEGTIWLDNVVLEKTVRDEAQNNTQIKASLMPVEFEQNSYALCENYPGLLLLKSNSQLPSARSCQEKGVRLRIDLPEWACVLDVSSCLPNRIGNERRRIADPVKESRITINGQPYRRFIVTLDPAVYLPTWPWNWKRIFVMAEKNSSGKEGKAYWQLDAGDATTREQSFVLKILPPLLLPSAPAQRFQVLISVLTGLGSTQKDLDDQYFRFWTSLSTQRITLFNHSINTGFDSELKRRIAENFKSLAMLGSTDAVVYYSPAVTGSFKSKLQEPIKDESCKNAKNRGRICPHYTNLDGMIDKYYRDCLTGLKQEYPELPVLVWDFEPDMTPFCEKNRILFQKFLNLPDVPSDTEIRQKYERQWADFRRSQSYQTILKFAAAVHDILPKTELVICSEPLKADTIDGYSGWCPVDIKKADAEMVVDWHLPMIYSQGTKFYDELELTKKQLKKAVFPLIDPSEMLIGYYSRYTPEGIKQNIVAAAALGAPGIGFWLHDAFTGNQLQAISDGFKLVASAEDFYFDGQRVDTEWIITPANVIKRYLPDAGGKNIEVVTPDFIKCARTLVHRKGNEYVLTLLNYSTKNTIFFRAGLPKPEGIYRVSEINGPVYTKNNSDFKAGDLLGGVLIEVPPGGVKVIRVTKIQAASSISGLAQEKIYESLSNELSRITKSNFKEIRRDGVSIKEGLIKGKNPIPVLVLGAGGGTASVNTEEGGKVLSWKPGPSSSDILAHKDLQGELGELIFYDTTQAKIPYRFNLENADIGNGAPHLIMTYMVPPYEGANPTPNPLEGLKLSQTVTLSSDAGTLSFKYAFTNMRTDQKPIKLGFRIRNIPLPGGELAGDEPLTSISKIELQSAGKAFTVKAGAPENNLFLQKGKSIEFLSGTMAPDNWSGGVIKVLAEKGSAHKSLVIEPDIAGTAGVYVWWSNKMFTIELLSNEETLIHGETREYIFRVRIAE